MSVWVDREIFFQSRGRCDSNLRLISSTLWLPSNVIYIYSKWKCNWCILLAHSVYICANAWMSLSIFHECMAWIEKSITMVTNLHHGACPSDGFSWKFLAGFLSSNDGKLATCEGYTCLFVVFCVLESKYSLAYKWFVAQYFTGCRSVVSIAVRFSTFRAREISTSRQTSNQWYIGQQITVSRHLFLNSLTTEKQTTKFSSANFQKMLSPSYIILRTQRLEGKQCRSRWGGALWATSLRSTLFANSAIFVTGS